MLISCPECKAKVSDTAHVCPHCGFRIDTLIRCPECRELVRPGTAACPNCGYQFPVDDALLEDRTTLATFSECGEILSEKVQTCPHCSAPVLAANTDERQSPGNSMMKPQTQEGVAAHATGDTNASVSARTMSIVPPPPAQSASKVVSAEATRMERPATKKVSRGIKRVWYYAVQGLVYGPTSADDLYDRIIDGRLPKNVSVWIQGSRDWTPATDYVLLGEEAPDVADIQWQDSLAESDARPPMTSTDGKTTYDWASNPDQTVPGAYIGTVVPGGLDRRPHPWLRYLARMLDLYAFTAVLGFVSGFLGLYRELSSNPTVAVVALNIVAVILWIPLESLWLCRFGTTPGKLIFGLSVRAIDGRKLNYGRALQRSALVAAEGLALGVPLLNIFALVRGWGTLNSTKTTWWDFEASSIVLHPGIFASGD